MLMRESLLNLGLTTLAGGLWLLLPGPLFSFADEPSSQAAATLVPPSPTADAPSISLLDALEAGDVSVDARGDGEGRMTLSVTNQSTRTLRVVLPPGLIASGATGQFGGMGGMGMGGGMMGGMGGMGGGMMGGMGGMGGGMMGGMGGGMGMGADTLPSSMGMMMLGRMIMNLVGDRDSWDQASLMSGMGGMGMGGMGGGMGMGGMGGMGGGMGGRGGGFRSVPPTSLPFAALRAKQTRHLPTRLVDLSLRDGAGAAPAKGERLRIGEIGRLTNDPRVQTALKRLSEDKAPQNMAQLVMWRVAGDRDWETISSDSKRWVNPYEMTLARSFVERLEEPLADEAGILYFTIQSDDATKALATALTETLKGQLVLGLKTAADVPAKPVGPAVACKVKLQGEEAIVRVGVSNASAQGWNAAGQFTLSLASATFRFEEDRGSPDASAVADALAEGVLDRLVRVQLAPGPRLKGKPTYKLKVENASPLILNGLAVQGKLTESEAPKVLSGVSLSPSRSLTVPATDEVVKALGLKKGIRVIAADLSAL